MSAFSTRRGVLAGAMALDRPFIGAISALGMILTAEKIVLI